MTPLEMLHQAKQKISKPENWCKGNSAVNAAGAPVPVRLGEACRWCSVGSVRSIRAPGAGYWDAVAILDRATAYQTSGYLYDVIDLNDHLDTTHDDVMKVFDRAMLLARTGDTADA